MTFIKKLAELKWLAVAIVSTGLIFSQCPYDLANVPEPQLLPGAINWCIANPGPTVQVANHSAFQSLSAFQGYVWEVVGGSYYQLLQQGPSPTYTFTTPPPLMNGLFLRVRVALQGDGISCGNDSSKTGRIPLFLDTVPPTPVLSGPSHICFSQTPNAFQVQNHNVISAYPGFIGYTWELNGSSLGSTGTIPTYTFLPMLPSGTHTVKVYALFNSLCANYTTHQVTLQVDTLLTIVDMLPPPVLVSDQPLPFCYSYPPSVTVSVSNAATIQNNPGFVGFSWKINGAYQAGVNSSSLTINAPQVDMTVECWAIYRNLCGKDSITGRPIYLTLFNPTFAAPFLGETFPYCQPDSVVLQVYNHPAVSSGPGFTQYKWYMNGQFLGTSTGATFTVYNPPVGGNLIQAHAFFQHSCGIDSTTGTGYVYIGQPPQATPALNGVPFNNGDTISMNGPTQATFTVSSPVPGGNAYAWSLWLPGNNTPQTNQNGMGTTFIATLDSNGVYRIILQSTNYAACVQLDTVYIKLSKTTAMIGKHSLQAVLYPNPTSGLFHVQIPGAGKYRLAVLDGIGRRLYETDFQGPRESFSLSLPPGVYQIIITGEGGVDTHRLMIQD